MRLIVHNELREPRVIDATRVIIEDDLGNPVCAAVQFGPPPGGIIVETADAKNWNQVLRNLGIDKTVVVTDIEQKPLDQIVFE